MAWKATFWESAVLTLVLNAENGQSGRSIGVATGVVFEPEAVES
jgi:hypothetical protein